MIRGSGGLILEFSDSLRMNQLVQDRVDLDAFNAWFEDLADDGRRYLAFMLLAYAENARVTAVEHSDAVEQAGLSGASDWLTEVEAALWSAGPDDPKREWLGALGADHLVDTADPADLPRYFRWAVCVFGIAAGRSRRDCGCEGRYHWWHYDLNEKRIVKTLLKIHAKGRKSAKPWWKRLFG